MPPNDEREKQQQMMFQPMMPPHMGQDNNRIDVNLIAMLLWQSLLVGTGVYIASKGIYLESATPATKGLQYGLICFGFLCASMVLFHVGGVRDSLAMRAEFSRENQAEKWYRSQMRLQQRRMQKQQMWNQQYQNVPQNGAQTFGLYQGQPSNEKNDQE